MCRYHRDAVDHTANGRREHTTLLSTLVNMIVRAGRLVPDLALQGLILMQPLQKVTNGSDVACATAAAAAARAEVNNSAPVSAFFDSLTYSLLVMFRLQCTEVGWLQSQSRSSSTWRRMQPTAAAAQYKRYSRNVLVSTLTSELR